GAERRSRRHRHPRHARERHRALREEDRLVQGRSDPIRRRRRREDRRARGARLPSRRRGGRGSGAARRVARFDASGRGEGVMGPLTILKLALRALGRNRIRSMLTMLGVIIGVAAVIAMVSLGAGAQAQVSNEIASMGANILYVWPGSMKNMGMR